MRGPPKLGEPPCGSSPSFSFQAQSLQHFVLSSFGLFKVSTLLSLASVISSSQERARRRRWQATRGGRGRVWVGCCVGVLVRFGVYKAGGCRARWRPNGRVTALEGAGSGRRAAGQAAWAAFAGSLPSGRGQAWASPALATSAAVNAIPSVFIPPAVARPGQRHPGYTLPSNWWGFLLGCLPAFVGLRPTPSALCHSPVYIIL